MNRLQNGFLSVFRGCKWGKQPLKKQFIPLPTCLILDLPHFRFNGYQWFGFNLITTKWSLLVYLLPVLPAPFILYPLLGFVAHTSYSMHEQMRLPINTKFQRIPNWMLSSPILATALIQSKGHCCDKQPTSCGRIVAILLAIVMFIMTFGAAIWPIQKTQINRTGKQSSIKS